MPAQLIAITEGENILLDKPILLLGRHPECDIQIDSRKISRRHCCIAQVQEYLVIRDLGSTNGVRINGERVVEGRLYPSDELTIGNTRYKVSWDSAISNRNREKIPVGNRSRTEPPNVDAYLESADEPVALSEPAASIDDDVAPATPANLPNLPSHFEGPTEPRTALDLDDGPTTDAKEDDPKGALILPNSLELAPLSDEIEPPPPPPTSSS